MTKERPILFKGELVKAILDGRKTQTRRLVKFPGVGQIVHDNRKRVWNSRSQRWVDCPYGMAGDRLWVRETWALLGTHKAWTDYGWEYDCVEWSGKIPDALPPGGYGYYGGTEWSVCHRASDWGEEEDSWGEDRPFRWRPSIFMKRWASRLTLEITGVRVAKLQEISEEDAKAEGAKDRSDFIGLWEQVNGSWDDNPWVWVIDFKPLFHNREEQ